MVLGVPHCAMRVLVLGGSVFLGRALAEQAVGRGDEVTTLTRGVSGPVPEGARALVGDRLEPDGLRALGSGEWDLVVDVCRQSPTQVARSAAALPGRVGRYVYVSSVSVYAGFADGPLTEESVLTAAAPAGADEGDTSLYGPLKVRCEELVREGFGDRALIVRPGLLVGPGDPSDRFTYWVERGARGGPTAAPGAPGRPVQFVDVRDVAALILGTGVGVGGTYNVVGPRARITMGEVVALCRAVGGGRTRSDSENVVWLDDGFLLSHGVVPYADMPLWVPAIDQYRYFAEVSAESAVAAGLTYRSVDETVRDTLQWSRERGDGPRRAGLSPGREAELLSLWRARAQ